MFVPNLQVNPLPDGGGIFSATNQYAANNAHDLMKVYFIRPRAGNQNPVASIATLTALGFPTTYWE